MGVDDKDFAREALDGSFRCPAEAGKFYCAACLVERLRQRGPEMSWLDASPESNQTVESMTYRALCISLSGLLWAAASSASPPANTAHGSTTARTRLRLWRMPGIAGLRTWGLSTGKNWDLTTAWWERRVGH